MCVYTDMLQRNIVIMLRLNTLFVKIGNTNFLFFNIIWLYFLFHTYPGGQSKINDLD